MHIKKSLKTAPFLVSMLILAACGGGGGGDDEAGTTMALSSNNAHTVSAGESMSSTYSQNSKPSRSHEAGQSSASANDGFAAKLPGGSGSTPGDKLDPNNPTPDDVQPGKLHATSSSSSSLRVSTPGNEAALDNGKQPASRNGESAYAAASSASSAIRNPGNPVSGNSQPGPSRGASFAASSANSSAASSQAAPSAAGNDAARNPDRQVAHGGEAEHAAASSASSSARDPGGRSPGDTPPAQTHAASSSASSQASQVEKPQSFANPSDALDYALQTGDASVVSAQQLTEAAVAYLRTPAGSSADWISAESLAKLLGRLDKGGFSTTWSGCFTILRKVECDADLSYTNEFAIPSTNIGKRLRGFDAKGIRIFGNPAYRLEQLLVLLGDKYRQEVSYSSRFTKDGDKTAFLRAYFSDFASYMSRDFNLVAKNLGTFSGMFPDTTKTIERDVRAPVVQDQTKACPFDPYLCDPDLDEDHSAYVTGLYVLPGRSVTLTRTDTGASEVSFGINMLRDTTHVFEQLDRPTKLSSPRPVLRPNVPVTVTNPYGGPLFLFIKAAAGLQPDVTVRIGGVITHPVLRKPEDPAAIQAFEQEVKSTPANWIIVMTDMITLHTTVPNFKISLGLGDPRNSAAEGSWVNYHGDIQKFVGDILAYTEKLPYELAGFHSDSGQLVLAPGVKSFCDAQGWDCTGPQHRFKAMQQAIADLPHAGAGQAGNPYDQLSPFLPLGFTESHEMGHNLQRHRLNIYGLMSSEVSNNIFPVYKRIRYNESPNAAAHLKDFSIIAREDPANCPDLYEALGECVFKILKKAKLDGNPSEVKNAIWGTDADHSQDGERFTFYRQLVEFARYYKPDQFKDGWELYTLLYLLDRNFDAAGQNWTALRAKYGFGSFASPDNMSGNDFMLTASSFIIGRDMRPVFDMWGITYSTLAANQVQSDQLPAAEELFFPMPHVEVPGSQLLPPLKLAPESVYPIQN